MMTDANFDEDAYLLANPDVAQAIAGGSLESGRQHFERYGHLENRRARLIKGVEPLRRAKMKRLKPALRLDLPHRRVGTKYDFLSDNLKKRGHIIETAAISANIYSPQVGDFISRHSDGLLLDCGAGLRDVYYDNVVNFEIVDYDTTDVVGLAEELPFKDNSFDGVISIAVLEHVRDPFTCAAEIARILKPGGALFCSVPFLQPLHGYPHHYYNMTIQGIRALFEDHLVVDQVSVEKDGLPVWSLTWILKSWAEGLPAHTREAFLDLRVGDLIGPANNYLEKDWVTQLSTETNHELASTTQLWAHKVAPT